MRDIIGVPQHLAVQDERIELLGKPRSIPNLHHSTLGDGKVSTVRTEFDIIHLGM